MVPFKAIYQFLKKKKKGLTPLDLSGYTNVGESSIKNYNAGKRDGKPCAPKADDVIERLFIGICSKKLYDVNPSNYKGKAREMIVYLVSSGYINECALDINDCLKKIRNEAVPEEKKEFEAFLKESAFYNFFNNYVQLWTDERYRNAKPIRGFVETVVNPVLAYDDNFEKYMTQRLISHESGEELFSLDLNRNTCDWEFFIKNPLTLVTGPGGQGKTLFLYALANLHEKSPEVFRDIVIVPLINLTELSVNDINVDVNLIERYISGRFPGANLKSDDSRCLVLVDGFNEFRASPNRALVEKIGNSLTNFIRRILNRDMPNVSLVLTSREAEATLGNLPFQKNDFLTVDLSGTSESVYGEIRNNYEKFDFPFEGTEVEKLAKIPLYALMMRELNEKGELAKIRDKYALFDLVYKLRAKQRLGDESYKNAYDKAYYLYFYYVILPSFAYELCVSDNYTDYYFRDIEIEQLLKSTLKGDLDTHLYSYFSKQKQFGETYASTPRIDAVKLEEYLNNEESVIIKKDYVGAGITYRFEHQEWRDYLVAKYLSTNVLLLQTNYKSAQNDVLKSYRVNCNVDSNVARLVLQSLGMASTPEENAKKAKEFFAVGIKLSNYLYGAVKLLHTAFDFNEYLQLSLPVSKNKLNSNLHELFVNLTNYFLQRTAIPVLPDDPKEEEVKKYEKKLSARKKFIDRVTSDPETVHYLCEILSKETEYYRRRYNYKKVKRIVDMAVVFCDDSDIIRQQEAKLYLCAFEDHFTPPCREIDSKERCEELDDMTAAELFQTGMKKLRRVAEHGFHLSANTIGLFLTNPAPVLIKNVEGFKTDFCDAFRCYLNVLYAARYTRRDVAYTVRQALGLLIKGYIRIAEDNTFDPDDDYSDLSELEVKKCSPLFSQELDEQNAEFALCLAKCAEGQSIAGMNYLRGCAAYAAGHLNEARIYWNNPMKNETTLLYHIARKYRLHEEGLDKAIDEGFEASVKKIAPAGEGKIDLTHPAYWYIEAKETELAMLDGQEKENRRRFFEEIEQEHKAGEILQIIYDILL